MAVARNNGNRVDVTFIPHTVCLEDYNCSAKQLQRLISVDADFLAAII